MASSHKHTCTHTYTYIHSHVHTGTHGHSNIKMFFFLFLIFLNKCFHCCLADLKHIMLVRLAWFSQRSLCLSLWSAGIECLCYHSQLKLFSTSRKKKYFPYFLSGHVKIIGMSFFPNTFLRLSQSH